MNTLNELLSLGIDEVNANRMIDSYKLKIGTDNGDFKITDITYLGKETREVELTCQSCGMVIHKSFVNRRNKWSELQKNCMCKKQSKDPEKKRLYNNDIRYIGETYNGFQVIDFKLVPHKNKSGNTVKWICKCIICGEIKEYLPNDIKSGNKKCICQQETITYPRMKYIGLKFNRLTIIDFDRNVDKANHVYAVCKCECGNDYKSQLQFVIDGTVKSCGCYREDHKYDRKKDFRVVDSPLYATWSCMKQRCFNKKVVAMIIMVGVELQFVMSGKMIS